MINTIEKLQETIDMLVTRALDAVKGDTVLLVHTEAVRIIINKVEPETLVEFSKKIEERISYPEEKGVMRLTHFVKSGSLYVHIHIESSEIEVTATPWKKVG